MGLPQRGGPDFSVAGFLLLAAMGTFIWNSVPLDSARPNGKNKIDQVQSKHRTIAAKLWQDPFSALSAHIEMIKAKKLKSEQTKNNQKEDIKTNKILNCNLNTITENSIHETGIKNKSIMVIAIMLSPGNEPEKVEKRRRRRYAVVSALGESGFIPEESNTLHYCNLTKKLDGKEVGTPITVPFEWYVPDPLISQKKSQNTTDLHAADKIFVMWVEENYFAERPFGRAKDLAETIAKNWPTKDKLPYIYILGPARSDTLRKLASRAVKEKIDKKFFEGINVSGLHILSPTATMVDQLLVPYGYDNKKAYKKIQELYKTFSPKDCNTRKPCVTFQRTINTDDKLAELLVNEIKARNNNHKLTGYIALVSEWDTSFGRALPMTFEREYCQQIEDNKSRENKNKCEEILRFSYLRGIDGYIPGVTNNTTTKNTTSSRAKKNEQNKNIETKIHRPTGTGQYDYLRRLARKIEKRNKLLRAEGKGKITAIGILGSDVYDKLLILRVLRPQFPNLVFFTTDLDTQFLHPTEFRWTRNLIIASSFGLALNRKIQKQTPPFRNSYQTSIFFSTLLAAKYNYPYASDRLNEVTEFKDYTKLLENLPGLIYEVGRHSAVLLNSSSSSQKTSIHQQQVEGSPILTMSLLLLLAVILILVLHQTKPATGWLIIGTVSALVIVAGIAIIALNSGDYPEPVSFTEGVSVWPTEFIRFAAFCLSVYFLWRMYRDLKNNCSRISRDFFALERDPLVSGKTISEAWEKLHFWKNLKHYIHHPRFLPKWLRDSVLAFVAVNFSLFLSRELEISYPWIIPVYLMLILVLWFWRIKHLKNFEGINGWYLEMRKSKPQFIDDYWKKYCDVGDVSNRCYRTLTLYLLYMSFAVMVFLIFGLPEVPCRGVASCAIDKLMLMISIPTMLLLIFFVLDELRLSIFWIKGLTKQTMEWRSTKITTYCNTFELHTEAEKKWATMLLIADRTSEISRLIYYPFLIIIIMILSRNSYFDNWGFPQGLAIVVSINIVLLILSGIKLRRAAEAYRFEAIEFLNQKLFHLTATTETETTSGKQETIKQLEIIIRHISELNDGIFQPFRNQALMRASLLLLGAIGLTVGEYATLFN